jgi:hypothetical protein
MNERIRELAEQAGFEFNSLGGTYTTGTLSDNLEKFAELIVADCASQLVQANMSNPAYAQAMDEYYENKWSHRFD